MPTPIQNVGLFGTPGTLPSGAGPVEPDPLYQGPFATPSPGPAGGGGHYAHYPSPGYTGIIDWLARYQSMGLDFPTDGIDWDRLTPAGVVGPAEYPPPGTNAPAPPSQSVLSKIFGNIPAVKIFNAIKNGFNRPQTWRQNARSNPAAVSGPAGPSITPNTRSHWDFTRNAMVPNDFMGGAQNDSRMANALLMWDQGRAQPVNQTFMDRERRPRFFGNQGMEMDAEGGFSPVDFASDPGAATNTAASQALYQRALRAVPRDPHGITAQYMQRVNDWIRANGGGQRMATAAGPTFEGGPADEILPVYRPPGT